MNNKSNLPDLESGTYRHNKSGKLYEVIGVAQDTETHMPSVVYRPMYEHKLGYELFTRPHQMFVEIVELNGQSMPRFEKVDIKS